ncbi:UNVERIFIED_CONTAM: hypothetical protein Slati_1687200 [Sesamum latifolium]|uniref:Uncharacterized protein n=1 Tax=Sesamum latifolium TaxID=2727402 RepID=A0AAW2WVY9_9LAMI
MALDAGAENLIAYTDSQLITKQMEGEYEVNEERMKDYLQKIKGLTNRMNGFQLHQIPRTENAKDDYLAKLASSMMNCSTRNITVRTLMKSPPEHSIMTIQGEIDWRKPLLDYLEKDILSPDEKEESRDILHEIHEGDCGSHIAGWVLANKASRVGYLWPTLKKDAISWAKECNKCQQHAPLIHIPTELLQAMSSPCPFSQWGIDIVGPFSIAAEQCKFHLVAVDYFSKWIEAKPLARITENEVIKFL